jgi:hypothetical protein
MTHLALPQQTLFEHEMLAHITSEMRTAIAARNLSRLHAVTLRFQEHLNRMLALEEEDGYMSAVLESHPEVRDEIELRQREHNCFRMALTRILRRWPRAAEIDGATIRKVSYELLTLLEKLDEHTTREIHLLERALLDNSSR